MKCNDCNYCLRISSNSFEDNDYAYECQLSHEYMNGDDIQIDHDCIWIKKEIELEKTFPKIKHIELPTDQSYTDYHDTLDWSKTGEKKQ